MQSVPHTDDICPRQISGHKYTSCEPGYLPSHKKVAPNSGVSALCLLKLLTKRYLRGIHFSSNRCKRKGKD